MNRFLAHGLASVNAVLAIVIIAGCGIYIAQPHSPGPGD